jgi:hypothetical protein
MMKEKLKFVEGDQRKPSGRLDDDIGMYDDYSQKTDTEVLLQTNAGITRAAKEALRRKLLTRQELGNIGIIEQ